MFKQVKVDYILYKDGKSDIASFTCPEEWLRKAVISDGYLSLNEFYNTYTLDDGTRIYELFKSN